MANTFQIPGNIKLQFSPFVLNKQNNIYNSVQSSTYLKNCNPQLFTFRRNVNGQLNICPSSIKKNFSADISNKLLYSYDNYGESITLNNIFDQLPGIQIREFLPDTKLDQCINFFGDIIDTIKDLWSDKQDSTKAEIKSQKLEGAAKRAKEKEASNSFMTKMKNVLLYAFDYLTCNKERNIMTDIKSAFPKMNGIPAGIPDNVIRYVMTFPYTLYYRLQSCTTTNIYELPCKLNDNNILQSSGEAGWEKMAGFKVGGFMTKIPVIGSILSNILGNVGINYMPWWDSDKGIGVEEPVVDISFDLFNDTFESAITNFIFVNTIVTGNKWIQYNMFQHSTNLYDIKIEGINRLYVCSATFSVQSAGVLRSPSQKWLRTLESKHYRYTNSLSEKEIKIPDVYKVSMKFTSLMPANFNNYIFNYANNLNITNIKTCYEEGLFAKILDKMLKGAAEDIKSFINKGSPSTWE